ncbi:MAG: hypothetical protein U0414_29645 [Polyangiaceae bacterium]
MRHRPTAFALAILGLSANGCLFPAQVGAGATVVVPYEGPVTVTPEVRAGVHPLQLVEELDQRPVDAGAGLVVRWKDPATPVARPITEIYVEATGLEVTPIEKRAAPDGAWRTDEYSRRSYGGAITFWPGEQKRFGAEAIFKQEIGLFLHDEEELTYVHGELTVGAYAGLAFDTKKMTLSAGLMVRTPFAATVDFAEH